MAIVTLTNSVSPNTVERATDDQDPYERETQLDSLAHNFDDHDHTAGKNLGVGRVQTASAPDAAGEVRVNGDAFQWWGASAAAVRTAADLEGAQTVAGVKTFSAAPNFAAGAYLNDTANAGMTVGLTINQGAADNEIVALKSSDVAHGVTDLTETDTFGYVTKTSGPNGGLQLIGLVDTGNIGLLLGGVVVTEDTTHTGAARGAVEISALKKNGTGITNLPTEGNCLVVQNGGSTQFIVDADGDLFNNGASGTSTTFDDDDDGALVEAVATLMHPARARGYAFRLARDLDAHKAALAAGGVITLNPDGSLAMLSYKGMLGLLIDAIRQVTHAHRELEARCAPLLGAR